MIISESNVEHVARLAKLKLSKEELTIFTMQMGKVLDYMGVLNELETETVEPTNQVTGLVNVFREDVAVDYPEDKRKKILREVPKMTQGYIAVPNSINS